MVVCKEGGYLRVEARMQNNNPNKTTPKIYNRI
jgi:hypothetical protein